MAPRDKNFGWETFARYEVFMIVGILMTVGTAAKILGLANFSSDWLWLLAGFGFVVEGAIALSRQKKFEKKYKIIEKVEGTK